MRQATTTLARMATDASSTSQQAAEIKRSADAARRAAERGTLQMRDVRSAMAGLHEASGHIGQILRTIDGIAFQTNILALNAAVEAARAGTAGAGFAVVASEVRALAQRVAQAARDTGEKVEDSLGKSARGVVIIDEAAVTFTDIEARIREVDTLMGSLAVASSRQAETAKEMTAGMTEVHEVVATSERIASACESLRAEAADLEASFDVLGSLLGHRATAPSAQAAPGEPRAETHRVKRAA
jgi:methyl-accepting chemotaxis protein